MKKDRNYYMRQCKKTLERIQHLKPEEGKLFLKLKKKAAKYLELAKSCPEQAS